MGTGAAVLPGWDGFSALSTRHHAMINRFRVWDGAHMWVPSEANDDVARFGLERDGTLYFERDGELIETTDGYEVLHYTGLDDSEGTPIYESDILGHDGVVAAVE